MFRRIERYPELLFVVGLGWCFAAAEGALGSQSYDDYETPLACAACHVDIYQQWTQAMMSQAYTHHWDEIEYFTWTLPDRVSGDVTVTATDLERWNIPDVLGVVTRTYEHRDTAMIHITMTDTKTILDGVFTDHPDQVINYLQAGN